MMTVEQIRAYCERKGDEKLLASQVDAPRHRDLYGDMTDAVEATAYYDVMRFIDEDGAANYEDQIKTMLTKDSDDRPA